MKPQRQTLNSRSSTLNPHLKRMQHLKPVNHLKLVRPESGLDSLVVYLSQKQENEENADFGLVKVPL